MKKISIKCPICGIRFDPRAPYQHIQKHHQHAREHELKQILHARRSCFGKPKPIKNKSTLLLQHVTFRPAHSAKVTAR